MKENNDFNSVYKVANILCEMKSINSSFRIGQLLCIFIENMKVMGVDSFYTDDKQFVEQFEKWFNDYKKLIV